MSEVREDIQSLLIDLHDGRLNYENIIERLEDIRETCEVSQMHVIGNQSSWKFDELIEKTIKNLVIHGKDFNKCSEDGYSFGFAGIIKRFLESLPNGNYKEFIETWWDK